MEILNEHIETKIENMELPHFAEHWINTLNTQQLKLALRFTLSYLFKHLREKGLNSFIQQIEDVVG